MIWTELSLKSVFLCNFQILDSNVFAVILNKTDEKLIFEQHFELRELFKYDFQDRETTSAVLEAAGLALFDSLLVWQSLWPSSLYIISEMYLINVL